MRWILIQTRTCFVINSYFHIYRIHKKGVWYPFVSNFGHNPGHGDVYVHVSMKLNHPSNFTNQWNLNSFKARSVFSYFHDRKLNCKIFSTSNQFNDRLNQLGFKNFCFLIFLWEKQLRLEKHKYCVDSLPILICKHFFQSWLFTENQWNSIQCTTLGYGTQHCKLL